MTRKQALLEAAWALLVGNEQSLRSISRPRRGSPTPGQPPTFVPACNIDNRNMSSTRRNTSHTLERSVCCTLTCCTMAWQYSGAWSAISPSFSAAFSRICALLPSAKRHTPSSKMRMECGHITQTQRDAGVVARTSHEVEEALESRRVDAIRLRVRSCFRSRFRHCLHWKSAIVSATELSLLTKCAS